MEEKPGYAVDITPEGEVFYLRLLEYLYDTHSMESADRKSEEIMEMAVSLGQKSKSGKNRGKVEVFRERAPVFGL